MSYCFSYIFVTFLQLREGYIYNLFAIIVIARIKKGNWNVYVLNTFVWITSINAHVNVTVYHSWLINVLSNGFWVWRSVGMICKSHALQLVLPIHACMLQVSILYMISIILMQISPPRCSHTPTQTHTLIHLQSSNCEGLLLL